jgi:hypothetical protein
MFTNLINNKKFSSALSRLIATVHLKEHGIECYFENASEAISMRAARSEIFEALDKDVTKSAEVLFNAQPIIASIKDGRVREFDSIYNTVEDVFGLSFDKLEGTITLCGVVYEVGAAQKRTKAELKAAILKGIFGIELAELRGVLKTLVKYEETKDEYEKAILYPATGLADKIIGKIISEEMAFASYRKGMSHEEKVAFDTTFNRTGIDGVIQNSTFISANGIEQVAPSHKASDVKELGFLLSAGRLKYIEAVEIDGDGDIQKMESLVKQIENLSLNASFKFTLKARKLGNYKARGLFMQSQMIVAEDVRDTTAILHEIGHLIHLVDFSQDNFVNYMIEKLTPMVNVPEELAAKTAYYLEPTEVVARACEIAGLFAKEAGDEALNDDKGFALIKQRAFYKELSGIYFDFHTFDEVTKQELLALYKLFFATPNGGARPSGIDNFIKIDTRYKRVEKEKSYFNILNEARAKAEKELRALYSLVNAETIDKIFKNKKSASAEVLAMKILANISFCGNHAKKMTVEAWAEIIEDKAAVVDYVVQYLLGTLSSKEWILFIVAIRKNGTWDRVKNHVLLLGFSDSARRDIKKALVAKVSIWHEKIVEFRSTTMATNPAAMIDAEMMQDEEFVLKVLDGVVDGITALKADLVDLDTLAKWNRYILDKNPDDKKFKSWLVHPALGEHFEFMDEYIAHDKMLIVKASESYRNDEERMKSYFNKNGYGSMLIYLGSNLKDSVEFARPIIEANASHLEYFTDRVKTELANAGEVDMTEVEIEKLKSADTSYRRKIARTTQDIKVLVFLAKDRNNEIRAEVAKRDIAVAGILMDLAKLKNVWVRAAVAGNKNTPKPILDKFMKEKGDGSSNIFEALAKNPKLSLKDLLKISKEKKEHRYIKWNILCNQNILSFKHDGDLKTFREVVRNCIEGEEEEFHYQIRTADAFRPQYGLLDDMSINIDSYVAESGYRTVYVEMLSKLMDAPTFAKKEETQQPNVLDDFELLVAPENKDVEDFDAIVEQGEIVEFERTDGKGVELVLRVKAEIKDFKSFNQYLKENKKGYYSRIAKGFILYEEFAKELKEKLSFGTQAAASIAATLYSADALQAFANGTLF